MARDLQEDLDKIAGTEASESAIVNEFFAKARAFAQKSLSIAIQARVRPTAIANAALHSLIRKAKGFDQPMTPSEFEARLIAIVRNKVLKAVEHETAQKRDYRSEESSESNADAVNRTTPAELVAAKDLGEAITREILAEADESKLLIRLLGILVKRSSAEIHEALRIASETCPHIKVPKPRLIEREIADYKKYLLEKFLSQD